MISSEKGSIRGLSWENREKKKKHVEAAAEVGYPTAYCAADRILKSLLWGNQHGGYRDERALAESGRDKFQWVKK